MKKTLRAFLVLAVATLITVALGLVFIDCTTYAKYSLNLATAGHDYDSRLFSGKEWINVWTDKEYDAYLAAYHAKENFIQNNNVGMFIHNLTLSVPGMLCLIILIIGAICLFCFLLRLMWVIINILARRLTRYHRLQS